MIGNRSPRQRRRNLFETTSRPIKLNFDTIRSHLLSDVCNVVDSFLKLFLKWFFPASLHTGMWSPGQELGQAGSKHTPTKLFLNVSPNVSK